MRDASVLLVGPLGVSTSYLLCSFSFVLPFLSCFCLYAFVAALYMLL